MIILQKMRWSNCFSYGEDNEIDFSSAPLTQIVGLNGHGKSSIALILEEVLFNKNSKGVKKSDILNRNLVGLTKASSTYSIELTFEKNNTIYYIIKVVGTSASLKFYKNNVDISSHTATSTYKLIEETLGFDHKTFAQIVYQSNAAGLEFLTATDSARKKFLIDLLNLSKYVEAADVFKAVAKEINDSILVLTTKVTAAENWINKNKSSNTVELPILPIPESPRDLVEKVTNLSNELKSIEVNNKKITQNNTYKQLLDGIVLDTPIPKSNVDLTANTIEHAEYSSKVRAAKLLITKIEKAGAACPTCGHKVDQPQSENIITTSNTEINDYSIKLAELIKIAKEAKAINSIVEKQEKDKQEYEEYHALYNSKLPSILINKSDIELLIKTTESNILAVNKEIKNIADSNSAATAHNARISVILSQLTEMRSELLLYSKELAEVSARLAIINILVKTFSSTGLVAYKIECLIKDLEDTTNGYLNEISGGRFQLTFKIASADKLNVVITDNGKDIDILALSGGERARVNTATLLGIRKLMQSLSNARINLLILDETIESLDIEGKEKLIDVLLEEEYLNTFIISHGFTHPLLEKISVIKTNNISRIE